MTAIARYSRRNAEPRKPRRSTVTIPERASPAVKLVFAEMNRQNKTYDSVEAGSGINRPTVKAWRHKNHPNLESISAVLGFLNFEFVPIPRERALPDYIREALKSIADLLQLEMRDAVGFAFEIAYRQRGRSA